MADTETKEDPPQSLTDEVIKLTELPEDMRGWDSWDDWALYSRDTSHGFSLTTGFQLGSFEILGPTGDSNKFMMFVPVQGLYGFKEVPWLQLGLKMESGIATFSSFGERQFIIPITLGPQIQMRFVRFPPLAPFFIGAGVPLGITHISGGTGTTSKWLKSYGWEITVGMELAINDQHSIGFRLGATFEKVSGNAFVREFEKLRAGIDYRYYFSGKIFN